MLEINMGCCRECMILPGSSRFGDGMTMSADPSLPSVARRCPALHGGTKNCPSVDVLRLALLALREASANGLPGDGDAARSRSAGHITAGT